MNTKKILIAFLSSIILSACNNLQMTDKEVVSEETTHEIIKQNTFSNSDNIRVPNNFFLIDSSWKLDIYNGEKIYSNINVTMNFNKNFNKEYDLMVSGKSACNSYNTDIKIDTNNHNFKNSGNFILTKMLCFDPSIINMESNFIDMLKNNNKIEKYNNERIVLTDSKLNTYEFLLMKK